MKIIIIGAGISGLTFAKACEADTDLEIKIYEKAKALKDIGGGIIIWPQTINYLEKWLGLSKEFEKHKINVDGYKLVDSDGKEIFTDEYAPFYAKADGKFLPIERSIVQQILVNQLPKNMIELGKQAVEIIEEGNKINVKFADGSVDEADMVIGADGVKSFVRGNRSKLEYSSLCWWGGVIASLELKDFRRNQVYISFNEKKVFILWPTAEGLIWYLPVQMDQKELQQHDSFKQLKSICADWHNDIVQSVLHAPQVKPHFSLPINMVPPNYMWSTGRTTLIGDAAHALGPFNAQGASSGVEDAFVLFHCLQRNKTNIPVAITEYQALRAKTNKFYELEKKATVDFMLDKAQIEELSSKLKNTSFLQNNAKLVPLVDQKATADLAKVVQRKREPNPDISKNFPLTRNVFKFFDKLDSKDANKMRELRLVSKAWDKFMVGEMDLNVERYTKKSRK